MAKTIVSITIDAGTLNRADTLATAWGLSRSALLSLLVNKAYLEDANAERKRSDAVSPRKDS